MGLDYTARVVYGYQYDAIDGIDLYEDAGEPGSPEALVQEFAASKGCFTLQTCAHVFVYHEGSSASWDAKGGEDYVVEKLENHLRGSAVNSDLQEVRDFIYKTLPDLQVSKPGGGKLSWWLIGEVS